MDLFEVAGIEPIGVLITGDNSESRLHGRIYSIPNIFVRVVFSSAASSRTTKDTARVTGANTLVRELQDFRIDFSGSGRMTFGTRSGSHDDILLSLAIACWRFKVSGMVQGY